MLLAALHVLVSLAYRSKVHMISCKQGNPCGVGMRDKSGIACEGIFAAERKFDCWGTCWYTMSKLDILELKERSSSDCLSHVCM